MMSKKSDKSDDIERKLIDLGLSRDEAHLFMYLSSNPKQTPLVISRHTGIARTCVYRNLELLANKGLVIEHKGSRGVSYSAEHPSVFEEFLNEEIHRLEDRKHSIRGLVDEVHKMTALSSDVDVRVYKGIEGLKQMTWNSLASKGKLLTYEIGNLDSFIDNHAYVESLRQKFADNKIIINTLTNRDKIEGFTDVSDMIENEWEVRHLPKKTLNIKYEVLIYNDVYALYRYHDKQLFGVEIESREVADMQRQIFNALWNLGEPFIVENNRGKAHIKSKRNK